VQKSAQLGRAKSGSPFNLALYATSLYWTMKNPNTSLVCFAAVVVLCMSLAACASDERLRTGIVRDISEKRIELDLPSGSVSYIGFTCEPIICSSTHQFGVWDNVLLRLGAENNINKLLSIRLCKENDAECEKARNEELEERRYVQEQSEKW